MTGPDDTTAQAFLAALPARARHKLARRNDLNRTLDAMIASARQCHGNVAVSDRSFVEHLARSIRDDDGSAVLEMLHCADLYLAWACARADTAAIEIFEELFLDDIDDPDHRQLARERLFVRPATDRQPRVASYDGRGPLRDWVRIVVARALTDAHRREDNELDRAEQARNLAHVVSERLEEDPSLAHLKGEIAAQVKSAIEESLRALTAHERNLLRLRYLHGTSVDEMARLYNRHRVSMSRRLAKIQGEVLSRARRTLMARLEIDPVDLQATVGLVHSRLELTLDRLLRSEPGAP